LFFVGVTLQANQERMDDGTELTNALANLNSVESSGVNGQVPQSSDLNPGQFPPHIANPLKNLEFFTAKKFN
jgi:hypothetical protein